MADTHRGLPSYPRVMSLVASGSVLIVLLLAYSVLPAQLVGAKLFGVSPVSVKMPDLPETPLHQVFHTVSTTPTLTSDCSWEWRIVPSPNPGSAAGSLEGVAAVTSSDIWAVGASHLSTGGARTLILHWDGTQWTIIPSPNPNPDPYDDVNVLLDVQALFSNDAWAVGYTYHPGAGWLTLAEHWDGSQWSVVPSPNPRPVENYLKAVAAVSANDVWAVGYYVANIGGFGRSRTLVEHWDGSQWSIIPSPNVGTDNNQLWAVSAISTNDVWAVGYYTFGGQQTLTLHWDGTQWGVVPSPNPPDALGTALSGVSAISSTDVWAVGGYGVVSDGAHTVVEHWDGSAWSIVPSPNPGTFDNQLLDVAAISSTDVWAVGYYCCGPDGLTTLVEHWDGTQWSVVPSPNPGTDNNYLEAVAAVSASDVWAVGYFRYGGGSPWQTLTEHYANVCTTPTSTLTRSATLTPTRSLTATSTQPVYTATPTPSPIASATPTNTSTLARTPTSTRTPTATPTGTPGSSTPGTATNTPGITATGSPTPCSMSFSDVSQSDYFYEAVRYLYCRGVISGYGDGTFRPYNNTTRGQLTKIVVLGFGMLNYTPPTPTFLDVSAADTFYEYIETAYHANLVSGYTCGGQGEPCPGLYFRPGNQVTRGQIAKIVVLAVGWPLLDPPTATFRDVPVGSVFFRYVETAYDRGIISGYGCGGGCLEFRPGSSATRGQICKIVYLAIIAP